MTNLEYARLLIQDTDPTNQILTDTEINEFLKKNKHIRLVKAKQKSLDGLLYRIRYNHVDDSYTDRVFEWLGSDNYNVISDAVFDKQTGIITLQEPTTYDILVETKIVDWDNFRADVFETIAGNYRALQNYNAVNVQGNLEDTKSYLLRLAKSYRTYEGAEL